MAETTRRIRSDYFTCSSGHDAVQLRNLATVALRRQCTSKGGLGQEPAPASVAHDAQRLTRIATRAPSECSPGTCPASASRS
jgi:hypothetical protein